MNDSDSTIDNSSERQMVEFARCWSAAHNVLAAYVHSAIRDRHRAEELYDALNDPREYENLAGSKSHQRTIKELHDRVHE
jgi:hypothetical protein